MPVLFPPSHTFLTPPIRDFGHCIQFFCPFLSAADRHPTLNSVGTGVLPRSFRPHELECGMGDTV